MMGLYATVLCANLIMLINYAFDKRYVTSTMAYIIYHLYLLLSLSRSLISSRSMNKEQK